MKTALITGASQGIGAAIAYELNYNKIKVILVSRSKKKLKDIQNNLRYPKNSFVIAKDLRSLSCLLYTSPSPRDLSTSRMPSSA